ncbi:MAG TPA: hypothetical protein VEJ18_01815, partial [Planctomycetota bacterium]|nr:hypothetical protein [Planctomycetota bacterium]
VHNQAPGLYCADSTARYPAAQVEGCPESAGGGNVRVYLCTPEGDVAFLILGYWAPPRFLEELSRGEEILARPAEAGRLHAACRARHVASSDRAEKLLVRAHDEALSDWGRPVRPVLERLEDEIYTKGAIG